MYPLTKHLVKIKLTGLSFGEDKANQLQSSNESLFLKYIFWGLFGKSTDIMSVLIIVNWRNEKEFHRFHASIAILRKVLRLKSYQKLTNTRNINSIKPVLRGLFKLKNNSLLTGNIFFFKYLQKKLF